VSGFLARLWEWIVGESKPIEEMTDDELFDRYCDYTASKDWWAADIYASELMRRRENRHA
jgi:hypothetical protein